MANLPLRRRDPGGLCPLFSGPLGRVLS